MRRATASACPPRLSSSRGMGAPTPGGANDSVDRPVLSSTEMKMRSGAPVSLGRASFMVPDARVQREAYHDRVTCRLLRPSFVVPVDGKEARDGRVHHRTGSRRGG